MKKSILLSLLGVLISAMAVGQETSPNQPSDSVMITIMLKHHQDKNLPELRKIQEENGFLKNFPPPAARVISWYVMMGIGQVVTVKIPASELRNLNLSVENSVWGAFSTEFYPTYDLHPFIQKSKAELER